MAAVLQLETFPLKIEPGMTGHGDGQAPITSGQAPTKSGQAPTTSGQALSQAARQFEAILIRSLLEGAQDTFGVRDDSDPAASSLKDMGLQAVASGLAQQGGLGIGRMILKQLGGAADKAMVRGEPGTHS